MTWEQMERAIEFLTAQSADQSARIDKLLVESQRDSENIRAMARIAEVHHERLVRLEGGEEA